MLSLVPQGLVRFLRALSSPLQKETSISKLSRDPVCISHPCCLEPCSNWLGALTVCITHPCCLELGSNWLGALTASIINLYCLEQCSNWWRALVVCITPHWCLEQCSTLDWCFLAPGTCPLPFPESKASFSVRIPKREELRMWMQLLL